MKLLVSSCIRKDRENLAIPSGLRQPSLPFAPHITYKNHCRAQAAMNFRELVATTLICGDRLETSCPAEVARGTQMRLSNSVGINFTFDIIDQYEEKTHAASCSHSLKQFKRIYTVYTVYIVLYVIIYVSICKYIIYIYICIIYILYIIYTYVNIYIVYIYNIICNCM